MSKKTGSGAGSGATIDQPEASSNGGGVATHNPTTSEETPADVSAEKPKERSLPGPKCPKCEKTNTRVTKTVKNRAYPAFMGKNSTTRYYNCGDCGENFKTTS